MQTLDKTKNAYNEVKYFAGDCDLFSKISDQELLLNLERLVRSERKITEQILMHILEVESRKLFLNLGYESTYKYLTRHLGYSESAAYDRLQAARVLKQVPRVGVKLQEGKLNLTQLVKLEQSLKQEKRSGNPLDVIKTEALLAKLENKTTYESEKILAVEFNFAPKTYQKIKPQQDESVRIELTLTREQFELLQKTQSLLSHTVTDGNLADVISYLAKSFVQKKEGKFSNIQDEYKPKKPEVSFKKSATQSFRVMPKPK